MIFRVSARPARGTIPRFAAAFLLTFCVLISGGAKAVQSPDETSFWRSKPVSELRAGAERGNRTAQRILGSLYLNGESVAADAKEAARWFTLAGAQGDPLAQLALGMMADEGEGLAKNEIQAAEWYRKAAEQGLPEAQVNLARLYARGAGVPQDDAESAQWFRRAAEQGDLLAQTHLGFAYLQGKGVSRSVTEALRWLKPAAYQGSADAAFYLGLLYQQGEGVARDSAIALTWFMRAAERGHHEANYHAAAAYLAGPAAERSKALPYLRKGAELGLSRCEHLLGLILLRGELAPMDRQKAEELFTSAANHGDKQASALLADPASRQARADVQWGELTGSPALAGASSKQIPVETNFSAVSIPTAAQTSPPPSRAAMPKPPAAREPRPPHANDGPRIFWVIPLGIFLLFAPYWILNRRIASLKRELEATQDQIEGTHRRVRMLLDRIEASAIADRPVDLVTIQEAQAALQLPDAPSHQTRFKARRPKETDSTPAGD